MSKEATLSREATTNEIFLVATMPGRAATPMFDVGSQQSVAPLINGTSPALPYQFFPSNFWGVVGFGTKVVVDEADGDPAMSNFDD